MTATAFGTDAISSIALREELLSVRFSPDSGASAVVGTIVAENATDHTFHYLLSPGATPSVILKVDTPPNLDNVLLWVEVFSGKAVVFTELF